MDSKAERRDYGVRDVAALLGTNPRRVEGWVEKGFIKPAVRGRGSGRRNRFDLGGLLLGALLLEVQASFGEKSPVASRLFPEVADSVMALARAEKGRPSNDEILVVAHREGRVTNIRLIAERLLLGIIAVWRKSNLTLTLLNVSEILARLRRRIQEFNARVA